MRYFKLPLALLALLIVTLCANGAPNPFIGDWALTIPGGGAGWLGVDEAGNQLKASMLWGGGSVFPLESAKMEGDNLVLNRKHTIERQSADGKKIRTNIIEVITCTADGDSIRFSSVKPRNNGQGQEKSQFTGKRQPPLPAAPDLKKVKYAPPIQLFNGKDLSGWRLTDPNAVSGWSVKDGLLSNNPIQQDGKPHINYGNLRTDAEFSDFNLKLEVRV